MFQDTWHTPLDMQKNQLQMALESTPPVQHRTSQLDLSSQASIQSFFPMDLDISRAELPCSCASPKSHSQVPSALTTPWKISSASALAPSQVLMTLITSLYWVPLLVLNIQFSLTGLGSSLLFSTKTPQFLASFLHLHFILYFVRVKHFTFSQRLSSLSFYCFQYCSRSCFQTSTPF